MRFFSQLFDLVLITSTPLEYDSIAENHVRRKTQYSPVAIQSRKLNMPNHCQYRTQDGGVVR